MEALNWLPTHTQPTAARSKKNCVRMGLKELLAVMLGFALASVSFEFFQVRNESVVDESGLPFGVVSDLQIVADSRTEQEAFDFHSKYTSQPRYKTHVSVDKEVYRYALFTYNIQVCTDEFS